MLLQNVKKVNDYLRVLNCAVRAKGVKLEVEELKQLLDITHYEMNNPRMVQMLVNKFQFEYEQDEFKGLANAVKLAYQIEHVE